MPRTVVCTSGESGAALRKDSPPGREGAWPTPQLLLSAAERDCDGRPRESRAKLTCCVRSGSPSLSHLLQRGQGTREGTPAESQRLRLRDSDRRKLGKEHARRRRNRSAGSELTPAAGERDREEESTGPRYDRQHPLLTLAACQHLTACVHTSHCVATTERHYRDASLRVMSVVLKVTAI